MKKSAGFTLIELLVVVVIIGMLAAFVAPKYFDQVGKSSSKIAKAQIVALEQGLDQYRLDTGHYPTTEIGLSGLMLKPTSDAVEKWQGPYLKKDPPNDPWGNPFIYRAPGQDGREYDLLSYGADGKPGGSGQDADITSW